MAMVMVSTNGRKVVAMMLMLADGKGIGGNGDGILSYG